MKLRQFASILRLLIFLIIGHAKAQSADDITGIWFNTEKTAKIKITKAGDTYEGEIVWLKDPNPDGKPALDVENDDEDLQKRPLMGLKIIEGLKFSGDRWKDGEIYDPKSGNMYSSEVQMKNKDTLEVKGYVGFSFIGRTVEWTRTTR
ncbi:DUF2147 domain-containing protein [Algoriphagus hitonicola]|uniref:DUF2147 domain-containing protein n=1 Tax=Algoriphagus hitonicola TaxID=435880 RepID=A0A1I2RGD0_9BACT|nr:DUF2147 domain-containing protein [Algoriphagus hitonicola]SFG37667.1 hypothetical protein SAMN04487988_103160 [Algoriphagus hitonicola]